MDAGSVSEPAFAKILSWSGMGSLLEITGPSWPNGDGRGGGRDCQAYNQSSWPSRPSAVSRTACSSARNGGRSSAERRATKPER